MNFSSFKNSYFSVADQILLSLSNFAVSALVLFAGGVADLGIYSFVFVFVTLLGQVLATLLHRQMMLAISSSGEQERKDALLATLIIQLACIFTVALFVSVILKLVVTGIYEEHKITLVTSLAYITVFACFELFRQYLYICNKHSFSFRCTTVFAIVLVVLCTAVYIYRPGDSVSIAYGVLALAVCASLATNSIVLSDLKAAHRSFGSNLFSILQKYMKGGKFALAGMSLSWLQNQSINPFLMWFGGPIAAGYFSVARMITMPAPIVNQGLLNSSAPQMRRNYESRGMGSLNNSIYKQSLISLGFIVVTSVLLFMLDFYGVFDRFVPEYQNVKPYLAIWFLFIGVTMQRAWASQFFVIRTEFKYLMLVTAISVAISAVALVVWAGLSDYLPWAVFAIVLAESIALMILTRRRYKLLAAENLQILSDSIRKTA